MKRATFIILATTALCNCNRSDEGSEPRGVQPHEIEFTTSLCSDEEVAARGSIVESTADLQQQSFMLYATAYDDTLGGDYAVANAEVEYESTDGWAPSDGSKIYWPTSESDVTFYAWIPSTTTPLYYAYGQIGIEYDTNAASTPTGGAITLYKEGNDVVHHNDDGDVALQDDLMYCITTETNPTQQSVGGTDPNYTINLQFVHLLTTLRFDYKTEEGIKVRVKALTLHNIKSKGRFAHYHDADGKDVLAWVTYDTTDTPYEYPLPNYHAVPMEWGASDFVASTDTTVPISGDNDLMVFPQEWITAWVPNDGTYTYSIEANDSDTGTKRAYLQIYCDIATTSGTLTFGDNKSYTNSEMTIDPDYCIYVPINSKDSNGDEAWKAGNIVTYTLTFGSGYDKDGEKNDDTTTPVPVSVAVTATLNGWMDGGSYDVEF